MNTQACTLENSHAYFLPTIKNVLAKTMVKIGQIPIIAAPKINILNELK